MWSARSFTVHPGTRVLANPFALGEGPDVAQQVFPLAAEQRAQSRTGAVHRSIRRLSWYPRDRCGGHDVSTRAHRLSVKVGPRRQEAK